MSLFLGQSTLRDLPVHAQMSAEQVTYLIVVMLVLVIVGFVVFLAKRYRRCPANRVLVVYGSFSGKKGEAARCIHGGGAFVWPLIQSYDYLGLDPLQIEIPLSGALSAENIRINVPSVFTVAIGTTPDVMHNAAVRLQGLQTEEIAQQARDIIFGQLRQVIAGMRIEDINRDRDLFLQNIQNSMEPELRKMGLVLLNVNITDITDESGYIEAIGKKAASEAVQQAEIDVAQQRRHGAIGVAEAKRDEEIRVAVMEKERSIGTTEASKERAVRVAQLEREQTVGEQEAAFAKEADIKDAERRMRIAVAEANAGAVAGENESKAKVADVNARLKIAEAEAYQSGESRTRQADAAVREAQYAAEAKAAEAEALKVEAQQRAVLEAPARAEKAKITVEAEAEAEKRRIEAAAEAEALFLKLEAEARGQYEMLAKKADGLRELVDSCGGAQSAFQLLMLEHIDKLSETAATAISNVKFDKVVVWDGGGNGDGKGGTAQFVKSLGSMLPPMMEMMRDVGGVQMPEFFGKLIDEKAEENGATPTPAHVQSEAEEVVDENDGESRLTAYVEPERTGGAESDARS